MKLLFSTAYDGRPYKENDDGSRPVGPLTLLSLLERELGLFDFFPQPDERLKAWLDCLKKSGDDNFFYNSLQKDELKVSQELLGYRDELIAMGWQHNMKNQPQRLGQLATVEAAFQQTPFFTGIPDRWRNVLQAIEKANPKEICFEYIVLHDKTEHLPPMIQRVLKALGNRVSEADSAEPEPTNNLGMFQAALRGKKPKRTLAPLDEDPSLQLIRFNNQQEMCDAMAYCADAEKHVFINRDNANFDYSLVSFGKSASGSKQLAANPMTIQLYKLVIPCITGELNIHALLSLLQLRYSPIDRKLSYQLTRCLADKPGVGNAEWNAVIENYLSGQGEDAAPEEHEIKRRQNIIELFLTFEKRDDATVRKRAKSLLQFLQKWIQEKCKAGLPPEIREQFTYLDSLCQQTLQLIPEQGNAKEIEKIFQGIYESTHFTNYQRQQNSVCVVDDFGAVASTTAKEVVALNFYDHPLKATVGKFLLHEEREFLKDHSTYYSPEAQVNLQLEQWVRGIARTQNKLKLCFIEQEGVDKHPLHIRMESLFGESTENILAVVQDIQNDIALIDRAIFQSAFETQRMLPLQEQVEALSDQTFKIIPRRPVESVSSLERFIEYPLDWVLQYVALFEDNRGLSIPSDNLLLGNIAHKVVENLFIQHAIGQSTFNISENEFKITFDHVIHTEGATFLQPENRFAMSAFRYKLWKSVRNLQEIITGNNFVVEACEQSFGYDEDCIVDEALGYVRGYIDLLLKDSNGQHFIIDMKWTYSDKKYIKKIEDGAAIQLALYTAALNEREQARTAYFLLDQGKLLTAADLKGRGVQKVPSTAGNSEILSKLKRSLEFRWSELRQGKVEFGEGPDLSSLAYHQEPNLIPLPEENNTKKTIPYTGFNFLKGTLQ
ncbi:MAG: hypothetical protein EA392_09785 [Cryomorphaceae bacterium]|nr:MAG: hypothetical protein EA392_09785 [Cryomorphaceae bacterium]